MIAREKGTKRKAQHRKTLDYPGHETNEEWNKRLDKAAAYQKSIYKPAPPKRPYNAKEEKFYSQRLHEKARDVWVSKSLYKTFLKSAKQNLEDGDWKWIDNKTTIEVLNGSEFEILSKKFAVIFSQQGITKNDVVHFAVTNEILTYVALGGLWILGAIGSLGNKHILRSQQKIFQLDSSQLVYTPKVSSKITENNTTFSFASSKDVPQIMLPWML